MALGVVRMKRKACEDPAETLVIALKKSKLDDKQCEVYLKFAATFPKEDFESGQIQAAISKDKLQKEQWRQSPKHVPFHSTVGKRIQYYKAERKQKRLQVLAGRRLILAQSPVQDGVAEISNSKDSKQSELGDSLFVLYDIIEENEDPKNNQVQPEVSAKDAALLSTITCNGQPLQRVNSECKSNDYVYDVYYIAKGNIDEKFIDGSLSISTAEELVSPDDDDEPEVYYDDDDDSNDEDNWRNDYPDEDSDFEKNYDYYEYYDSEETEYLMSKRFQMFNIDENESPAYASYKARVLNEFDGGDDEDDV